MGGSPLIDCNLTTTRARAKPQHLFFFGMDDSSSDEISEAGDWEECLEDDEEDEDESTVSGKLDSMYRK